MGDKSGIEWTDATWNPLAGCTPVSAGCRNCYAASMALRLEAMGQEKYAGTAKRAGDGRAIFTGRINLDEEALVIPLRWRRPRRIFVNSMSDLFHEAVPEHFIDQVYAAMERASWHTFQVLTKRPERMAAYTQARYRTAEPAPHIWHGTSVENQAAADERIPELLKVPAPVRFLSCEPLLGPVDLSPWLGPCPACGAPRSESASCSYCEVYPEARGINWVIAGGESGPRARAPRADWFRSLRDQCQAAGVPFFFKQWGEYAPRIVNPPVMTAAGLEFPDKEIITRFGKHAAGRLLDGRTWDELPANASI